MALRGRSRAGPPRFSADDVALIRTCARHGITRSAFWQLPAQEQLDLLAYDAYRQRQTADLYERISSSKYPDGGALVAALIAAME